MVKGGNEILVFLDMLARMDYYYHKEVWNSCHYTTSAVLYFNPALKFYATSNEFLCFLLQLACAEGMNS